MRLHQEAIEVGVGPLRRADPVREVAAGQHCALGPRAAGFAQHAPDLVGRFFGQFAKRRDLAAPDGQQRRCFGVAFQQVIAGDGGRVARRVVQQRAHAGVAPDHFGRMDGALEVAAGLFAQVLGFLRIDARVAGFALQFHIGRADQRELALVGDRKNDPLVGVLEQVGVVMLEALCHHDVAALDQAQAAAGEHLAVRSARLLPKEGFGPGTGRVDQGAGANLARLSALRLQRHIPALGAALRRHAAGAGVDAGPARLGVERGEHHQAGVIDPAVGIHERPPQMRLQALAQLVPAQIHAGAARKHLAPGEMVVEEQAGANHPGRAHGRIVRHDEAQRPDDVGRAAHQHFALLQGLAHQGVLVVLQVAQAAVNQLGGGRRSVRCQVVLLAKRDAPAAARQVAGDAGAVDAAADHEDVAVEFAQKRAGIIGSGRRGRTIGWVRHGEPR